MLTPLFRLLHQPVSLPSDYANIFQRVWDTLPHRVPWTIKAPTNTIASDASDTGLGIATPYGNMAVITQPARNIYVREAQALGLASLIAPPDAIALCNNEALVNAVTRGHGSTLPWKLATAISLMFVNKRLWARWIPTQVSPADAPSRITHTQVPN